MPHVALALGTLAAVGPALLALEARLGVDLHAFAGGSDVVAELRDVALPVAQPDAAARVVPWVALFV